MTEVRFRVFDRPAQGLADELELVGYSVNDRRPPGVAGRAPVVIYHRDGTDGGAYCLAVSLPPFIYCLAELREDDVA